MHNHIIRRAEDKDIGAVLRLLTQVNMVHHNGRPDLFRGPATKYSDRELSGIFHDDGRPVFVYDDPQQGVLGYAFCILQQHVGSQLMTDIKTLYIDDLCVEEKARGQHIGKSLYEYVLSYARGLGCYNVTLNVWTLNPDALRFYEKMGMKPQKIGMEQIL
ncbi:MAG: GNAT family N-acetyltransferase [Clostridia bacterium]|nr:GNAT family N-acetyltransferase [Clostridia bacterium]